MAVFKMVPVDLQLCKKTSPNQHVGGGFWGDFSLRKPLNKEVLVELEGIEPSSKQGNHTLSTCLFQPSFSCYDKTWTTNHNLIL